MAKGSNGKFTPIPQSFIDHHVSMGLDGPDIDREWDKISNRLKGTLFEGMNIEDAFPEAFKKAAEGRVAEGQLKKGQSRNDFANYAVTGQKPYKKPIRQKPPPDERPETPPPPPIVPGEPLKPPPARKAAEARVPPKPIDTGTQLQMSSQATPGPPTRTFSTAEPPDWYKLKEEIDRALMGSYSMRDYPKAGGR